MPSVIIVGKRSRAVPPSAAAQARRQAGRPRPWWRSLRLPRCSPSPRSRPDVLEGEIDFWVEDQGRPPQRARVGGLVCIPRGTPHAFRIASSSARWLTLHTPAGHERFYRASGEPAPRDFARRRGDRGINHPSPRRRLEVRGGRPAACLGHRPRLRAPSLPRPPSHSPGPPSSQVPKRNGTSAVCVAPRVAPAPR